MQRESQNQTYHGELSSSPMYTETEALALNITLPDGTVSTIGACSDKAFKAYITERVKAFAEGEWQYFRNELFKDIDVWDASTRWYILNEMLSMQRDRQWTDKQRAKNRAKYHAKKKRGAA